jgi:hypothetical protein
MEVTHIPCVKVVRSCLERTRRNQPVINRSAHNSHPCDAADGGTIFIAVQPHQGAPVLNLLYEQDCVFSAEALFSRISCECCVYFGEAVSGATCILWTRSREDSEAASMVLMLWQECWHQNRAVEEPSHRAFFRRAPRAGRLPRKLSSRSRRIWRSVSSVAPAEIGSPVLKTQIPCFLCNPTPPLRGRSTILSSELSSSNESPARSCISSRTGFGKTTRPALSSVKVVVMNAIIRWHLPLGNANSFRTEIWSVGERFGLWTFG